MDVVVVLWCCGVVVLCCCCVVVVVGVGVGVVGAVVDVGDVVDAMLLSCCFVVPSSGPC